MANLNALGAALMQNDKVRAFLVVSPDGQALLGEGVADPESVASSAALCMIQLTGLESALGLGTLRQATFSSTSRQDMLLLKLGGQTLALFKKPGSSTTELTAQLREIAAQFEQDA